MPIHECIFTLAPRSDICLGAKLRISQRRRFIPHDIRKATGEHAALSSNRSGKHMMPPTGIDAKEPKHA